MSNLNRLGILEVGELCAQISARSHHLFRYTGRAVTGTPPGPAQRFWATASHRHAWHAELGDQRSPTVIVIAHAERVAQISRDLREPDDTDGSGDAGERFGGWWQRSCRDLLDVLDAVRPEIDDELDPNSWRMIDLVGSDLDALAVQYHALRQDRAR